MNSVIQISHFKAKYPTQHLQKVSQQRPAFKFTVESRAKHEIKQEGMKSLTCEEATNYALLYPLLACDAAEFFVVQVVGDI